MANYRRYAAQKLRIVAVDRPVRFIFRQQPNFPVLLPVEAILCGCGAAELIYAYCGVIGKGGALLAVPTFSEYEAALEAAGLKAAHFHLRKEDGFAVTAEFLEELRQTSCPHSF